MAVTPQKDPWWITSAVVIAEVGVEFKVFSFLKKLTFKQPFDIYNAVIGQAPMELPLAEVPPEEPTLLEEGNISASPEEPNLSKGNGNPLDFSPPVGTRNENIRIVYDNISAYLINISQSNVTVKGLVFNRIDNQGNITASYQADMWGNFYSGYDLVQPGYCLRITLPNSSPSPDCIVQVNFQTSQEKYHFWKETSTSRQFQILQNNTLIHTCEISADSCEFILPKP